MLIVARGHGRHRQPYTDVLRRAVQIAAFALFSFLLYFYGLTRVGLLLPDEPRYASIGRDMAARSDWITPHLWGKPWFEKPALLYWMIGAAYRAGLGDDLAPRLPVALVSVGFLIFFFLQVRREFGELAAGYALVILGTSVGWLAYGQLGVTDGPMSAAFAAAMVLAMRWLRSGGRRGLLLAGALLGLAVLAKGLVPLVLALPLIWVGRRRWSDLTVLGAGCLLSALPWYALCTWQNGRPFLDEFFGRHHFGRFTSGELLHAQPSWYYIPVFLGLMFPWTPLIGLLFTRHGWHDPRRRFLLAWLLWGLLFFSASTNKLPGYVLPLLPAVSVLAGIRLTEIGRARVALAACALLLVLAPVAAQVLAPALRDGLSRVDFASIQWRWTAIPLALAAAAFFIPPRIGVAVLATALTLGVVAMKQWTYPEMDRVVSARLLWRDLSQRPDPCMPPVSRQLAYGLRFYAGRELPACGAGSR